MHYTFKRETIYFVERIKKNKKDGIIIIMKEYNYTDRDKMLHDLNPDYIVEGDNMEGFNKVLAVALNGLPEEYTMNLVATSGNTLFDYIDGAIIIIYPKDSSMAFDSIMVGIEACGLVLDKALQLSYMDHTKTNAYKAICERLRAL